MIVEGDAAPEFSLSAVVDGEFDDVSLAEYLGDDIVILAFYPADFNPACSDEETDLDELDLFTMQKDVSILGISADSVYSHRAFADEYNLHIPLLADVHANVAADYGVAVEDPHAGHLTNRAVVVIDPGGEVQYAWQTEDLNRLPPVENVREAVDSIGGASTAEARYRVGHAHYVEARRAFTRAMEEFTEMEWMMAQSDFTRAKVEFEEAEDQFNTAVRFSEDETARQYFERAEEKAQALWQAAEWLADSASAYASGEGAEGKEMRTDAETPLETARDIHEPPDPDDFPPDEDPANRDDSEDESILPTEDDGPTPTLGSDIDETVETPEAEALADEMTSTDYMTETEQTAETESSAADGQDEDESDEIDDEELEEITAELEEQTQQAKERHKREAGEVDDETDDRSSIVEGPPTDASEKAAMAETAGDSSAEDGDEELGEDDIELDLADPTAGTEMEPDEPADIEDDEGNESQEEDEDGDAGESDELDSGNHGVPDSL